MILIPDTEAIYMNQMGTTQIFDLVVHSKTLFKI